VSKWYTVNNFYTGNFLLCFVIVGIASISHYYFSGVEHEKGTYTEQHAE
jgi:hypothetical protein